MREVLSDTELDKWLATTIEPDTRVLAVCAHDDYCIEPAVNRCACCELCYCDNHTTASLLCIGCEDWCETQEAMA